MKFRIIEWENGNGEKHWTVEVKGLIFWSHIAYVSYTRGRESITEAERYNSREDALKVVDRYVAKQRSTKVRKVNVEYITK